MKVVFVLEFDCPQHQMERVVRQVAVGLSGLRDIQQGQEPISKSRRETYLAINEDAESILAGFTSPPKYEQLTLFDPEPYTVRP